MFSVRQKKKKKQKILGRKIREIGEPKESSLCKPREKKEEVHVQKPMMLKEDIMFGYKGITTDF